MKLTLPCAFGAYLDFRLRGRPAVLWGLALPLTLLLLSGLLNAQEDSLETRLDSFLRTRMDFTDKESQRVFQGEIVVKAVAAANNSEVIVASIGRISVPKSFFIEHYGKTIEPLELHSSVRGRLFSEPPQLSDLDGLSLSMTVLQALKDCRIGDCNIKLSRKMIERFQKDIDWNSPDYPATANRLFREMLFQYLATYIRQGSEALIEYRDQQYSLKMVDEFKALLEESRYLNVNPAFYRYLKSFPRKKLENVSGYFFWIEEDLGLNKNVLSLNHLSFYNPGDTGKVALLINRQIYANHFFESLLGITGFIGDPQPGARGFYMIHIYRCRIDALRRGGVLSRMIRRNLHSGITSLLRRRMTEIRREALELYRQ